MTQNNQEAKYAVVPEGKYLVRFEKCEQGNSRSGRPMLKVWFRIMQGSFTDSMLFMNQVTDSEIGQQVANKFIDKAKSCGIGKDAVAFYITFKKVRSNSNPDNVFDRYYLD